MTTYTVSGMTFSHCVRSVSGDGFSDEAVSNAVAEAGYEVV